MRSVQFFRRVACAILVAVLLLAVPGASDLMAQGKAEQPYVAKAEEAILLDARTGRVLFEKNADQPVPPASMSKLMTMIMVFESLRSGTLTLDQKFKVSQDAWKRGGAPSGLSLIHI